MLRTLPFLLACLVAPAAALAHVAASAETNNRYVRVTLLPERARLTYTLIVGERPALDERSRIDADRSGSLDPAEQAAYGTRLAAQLAPSVTLDGRPVRDWSVADVGVADPRVSAGSFAVDLALDAVYDDPRAPEHTLTVDDAAAVPLPGEVELRIDESPGVRVLEAHRAEARSGIELIYLDTGNADSPGDRAVSVRFSVDPSLRPQRRSWPLAAAVIALVAGAAALFALARRRRRAD